ncbi:MAG TPA: methyltransferase [Vicinamibacterales bacterium]
MFSHGSKSRLTERDLGRFPGGTLFERIARAVCRAGCLPRKELYEAWETARRVRRVFRGGRVVDLGGGHGLVAGILLILDDTSPHAVVTDVAVPASAAALWEALERDWPRLSGRVEFLAVDMTRVPLFPADLVVSVHACGALTDAVLARASAVKARVAVLPCCHDRAGCDAGGLEGWMDVALAIDATRALRLEQAGYRVRTQTIPAAITPKNRLLIAGPAEKSNDVIPTDVKQNDKSVRH